MGLSVKAEKCLSDRLGIFKNDKFKSYKVNQRLMQRFPASLAGGLLALHFISFGRNDVIFKVVCLYSFVINFLL